MAPTPRPASSGDPRRADLHDRPLGPDVELARQLIEAWEVELG